MTEQTVMDGGVQYVPQLATVNQIVYLDFDGELTQYRNDDLDLTVSDVEVQDSGLTEERIAEITASLNEQFAGQNVLFVSDKSDLSDNSDYSTVYIGKTSSFEAYGTFAGLAETVDFGNQIKNDNAFVILDSTSDNQQIVNTIAHETSHLIGTLDHGGDGVSRYMGTGFSLAGYLADMTRLYGEYESCKADYQASLARYYYETMAYANNHPSSGVTVTKWLVSQGTRQTLAADTTASLCTILGEQLIMGGTAISCYVGSGGWQKITDEKSVASNTFLYGNSAIQIVGFSATAYDTVVGAGAVQSVGNYGSTVRTCVLSGGSMQIAYPNFANQVPFSLTDVTVQSGGVLNISSGYTHADEGYVSGCNTKLQGITYVAGTILSDAQGKYGSFLGEDCQIINCGTFVFGVDQRIPSDSAIVDNVQNLRNQGTYVISVSSDQTAGDYVLAGGASGVTDSFSVVCKDTDEIYGSISLVDNVFNGNREYSLYLNSLRQLIFSINEYSGSGPMISLTADSIHPQTSTLLTARTNDGSAIFYKNSNGEWVSYTGTITITENGTYYFKATDAAGNTGYAEKTFNNIFSGTIISGSSSISSGETVDNILIMSGGILYVSSGGTASNVVWTPCVGGVSAEDGAIVTYKNTHSGVFLGSSNTLLSSAAVMSGQFLCGHDMYVMSGGMASRVSINTSAFVTVYNGGTVERATINSWGDLAVKDKGTANSTTINTWGLMRVSSGGTANCTMVNSWGSMAVSNGGTATRTAVNSVGSMAVLSGGTATSTEVRSSGLMYISSGGTAVDTTVCAGGYLNIASGATANNVVWTPCEGTVNVADGAIVTYASSYSGVYLGSKNTLLSSASVMSENSLRSQKMFVMSGGTAIGTKLNVYGSMTIASGGTANSTTLFSRGIMYVKSGGVANEIEVYSSGNLYVSSGGTASNVVWTPCVGNLYVEDGAIVTYVSSYSGVYFGSSNKLLSSASVMSGASGTLFQMHVMSGGTTSDATVKINAYIYVSGGTAINTMISSGGNLRVSGGGTATDTLVESGGTMYISSGGVHSGSMQIANGAVVSACAGATIDFTVAKQSNRNTALISNWSQMKSDENVNFTITVDAMQSTGSYTLASGATGFDRIVTLETTGGTKLGTFTVWESLATTQTLYTLTRTDDVIKLDVAKNVITITADSATRAYDGSNLTAGYSYTGTLVDGDKLTAVVAGSITDVGTASNKVTSYKIMRGTQDVTSQYNFADTVDGTLTVTEAPEVKKAISGDFDGNGISDILFQNLTDSANPLGAWMDANKWNWNGALGPAAKSDWTVYGAFDFTGDGVCDIMFRSKRADTQYAVGYYDMGEGGTFKTMGWGVTAEWELANIGDFNGNGKSDILWKNTTNGYLGLWMDGTDQWVALPASALGEGQSIFGLGDVNGDNCDDILINSNGVLGAWDITGILDGTEEMPVWSSFGISVTSDWETFSCADFDGNGKADIVLWSDNGYIGTYMNCDGEDFQAIYPSASKEDWGIPGFGDYDGDGSEDVLVRNLASGALGYWDGNDNFAWHEIGSGVDSSWAVIA